jgi:hypothetical protein
MQGQQPPSMDCNFHRAFLFETSETGLRTRNAGPHDFARLEE